MKTQVKNVNKVRGAYVSAAVRNLKKSGLTGEVLQLAINAVTSNNQTKKPVKLPRKVSKAIVEALSKHTRVVVVNKGPKRFKVYALESYLSMKRTSSNTATVNKPWEYASKKSAENLIKEVSGVTS